MGRIFNNILVGGQGATRYGIYERETWSGKQIHPEGLQNNDFHVPNLANNDALYLLWDGTQAHSLILITDVDAMNANGLVPIITSGNLDADPNLDATFHLQAGPVLIDNGTPLEAPPVDFEGDARPQGAEVDIGPDEYVTPPVTP